MGADRSQGERRSGWLVGMGSSAGGSGSGGTRADGTRCFANQLTKVSPSSAAILEWHGAMEGHGTAKALYEDPEIEGTFLRLFSQYFCPYILAPIFGRKSSSLLSRISSPPAPL